MPHAALDPACPFATTATFDGWLHIVPFRNQAGRLSWRRPRGAAEAYLFGAAFVAAATLIRLAVDQFVVGAQFPTYFLAVICATLCGGICVGLFSVALTIPVAWYFFLTDGYRGFGPGEIYAMVAFVAVAVPIVLIVGLLQNAGAAITEARVRAALAEERARSADELRRWKDMFDNIEIGIYVIEPTQYKIILANPAFLSMHGLPGHDYIGTSLYDIHPPSEEAGVTTVIQTCAELGSVSGEHFHCRKDGSTFPVRYHGTIIRDTTGRVMHVIGTCIDITEQRELQNRWTDVVENADFGISIVDPVTNTFRLCNPAYAAAHLTTVDEMQGSSVFDFYVPAERERVAHLLQVADASGHLDFEADRLRKDGSTFAGRIHLTSVREPANGLRYRISTEHDISQERALQAQLRQSQRLEAIGQLCAGVAHDFNNLLQGIISHLELVDNDIVPRTTQENVGIAIRLSEQGGALVHQLLSFARRQLLLPRTIDLHDFLQEFARLLSRTLDPRISIELKVATGLTKLWADPTHLRNALLNLAINARDAMPSGGHLILEADHDGASKDTVVFRISDTGSGISPDDLSRVCEPFFSTKGLNGTGLGLSMVHGFVNQSGGDIRISSKLGTGTCVELSLPVRADQKQAAA